MGKIYRSKIKNTQTNELKLDKQTIIRFCSIFLISFCVLYISYFFIEDTFSSFYLNFEKTYFEKFINSKLELNRQVLIQEGSSKSELVVTTVFLDKFNPDNTYVAKKISTNIRREAFLPIIFLLSLLISTPIKLKKRILYTSLYFLIINIIILLKLLVFIYDNYNNPEYTLIELSFPISQIIYFLNLFFSITGASSIVIIPVLIWIIYIISLKFKEF